MGFSMWGMLGGALHVLVVVVAFFVVPVNRKPSSATAWLLLITIAPFLGVIIFLLIGSPKLPPRRRRLQRRMSDLIAQAIDRASDDQAPAALLSPSVPAVALPHAALAERLGGMPAFAGMPPSCCPSTTTSWSAWLARSRSLRGCPIFQRSDSTAQKAFQVAVLHVAGLPEGPLVSIVTVSCKIAPLNEP